MIDTATSICQSSSSSLTNVAKNLAIPEAVRASIAAHIQEAIPRALDGYLSAHEDEDTLTGHVGATLRTGTHTVFAQDVEQQPGEWKWRIDYRKFRGRGPHAAERYLGADGIFEVRIVRGRVEQAKSVLFQAKKEWHRDPSLLKQAVRLTTWREAAFVINYTPQNIEAILLDDVIAARGNRSGVEHVLSLSSFLNDLFLPCSIGDTDLNYDAVWQRLTWRAMDNELVATDFFVSNRIRIGIQAPLSGRAVLSRTKLINSSDIHNYRMKADDEDILGVSSSASEKEKTKARNAIALAYHSDRVTLDEELLNELLKRRAQEANVAYDRLKRKH